MNDLEFQKTDAGREFAILGLVLGLASFFLVLLPFVGVWALIPSGAGLLLTILGIIQAGKGNGKKGLLLSAFVVSAISLIFVFTYHNFFAPANKTTENEKLPNVKVVVIENLKDADSLEVDSVVKKELEKVLENFEEEIVISKDTIIIK